MNESNPGSGPDNVLSERIKKFLDDQIRPLVQQDGGDVTFEGYQEGTVKLKLRGACSGCPGAQMTLKVVIEGRLKEIFPEVRQVVPA